MVEDMIKLAKEAASRAYAPYSGFKVGAVLVAKSGNIYTGCNVENSSYGLTICAERTALFKAISEGDREFVHLVIYNDSEKVFYPCGACRQTLVEFSPEMKITIVNNDEMVEKKLSELLPEHFKI